MAKEYSDFQIYNCNIVKKEDINYPKFCPSCVIDPNFQKPVWYEVKEAYLDKSDCMYKFNVTRVINDIRGPVSNNVAVTNEALNTGINIGSAVGAAGGTAAVAAAGITVGAAAAIVGVGAVAGGAIAVAAQDTITDEEPANSLGSFAITFANHTQPNRDYNLPSVQSKIIRTGLFYILDEFNKQISYENICNTKDCSYFEVDEVKSAVNSSEEVEELNNRLEWIKTDGIASAVDGDRIEFDEIGYGYTILNTGDEEEPFSPLLQLLIEELEDLLEQRDDLYRKLIGIDPEVFNPFGLENLAYIEEVYIPQDDSPLNVVQFLVAVPAFAVDALPQSAAGAESDTEETEPEDFVLNARRLRGQLKTIKAAYFLYASQYAVSRYIDGSSLYYKGANLREYDFEAVRRHMSTFPKDGKIDFDRGKDVFFTLLKKALLDNDHRIDNFSFRLGKKLAQAIKFKVDPNFDGFKIKKIFIRSRDCDYQRMVGASTRRLIKYLNNHQFVIRMLTDIEQMANELKANTTPEWQDFVPKYAYPEVVLQEAKDQDGISESNQQAALDCLFEDLGISSLGNGGLRNYALEKIVSLAKLLAFSFDQIPCYAAADGQENNPNFKTFSKYFNSNKKRKEYRADWQKIYEEELARLLDDYSKSQAAQEEPNSVPSEWANFGADAEIPIPVEQIDESNRLERIYQQAAAAADRSLQGSVFSADGYSGEEIRSILNGTEGHPLFKEAKELAFEKYNYEDSFLHSMLSYIKDGEGKVGPDIDKMLQAFGICGFKTFLGDVLKCLLGGVDFNTFVRRFIASSLKNLTLQQLGLFFEGLPPEEQAKILEEIQRQFGQVLQPWNEDSAYTTKVNEYTGGQPLDFGAGEFSDVASVTVRPEDLTEKERSKLTNEGISFVAGGFGPIPVVPTTSVANTNDWNNLTDRQKEEIIQNSDYGRPRVDVEDPNFNGNFTQTTVGTAVNNITGILVEAYIKSMINVLDLDILLDKIEDFPGTKIIKKVLFKFACMTPPLLHPPFSEFLNSFSLQVCDPSIGITWPKFTKFKFRGVFRAILGELKELFLAAVLEIFRQILRDIIYKAILLIDSLLCRALEGIGKFAGSYLKDAVMLDGSGMNFQEAMRQAFCGPDVPQERVDAFSQEMINQIGYTPDQINQQNEDIGAQTSASQRTMAVIGGVFSTDQIINFISCGSQNLDTTAMRTGATAINAVAPELTPLLGTPEKLANFFASISNLLSPEQQQALQDALQNPIPDEPIISTLCLTNDQHDAWRENRRNLYEQYGFDDPDGIVDDQDNATGDLLENLLDAYIDPLGPIQNAISDLLQEPEPGCEDAPGVIPRDTPETVRIIDSATNDIFENVQMAMYRDLFGNDGYFNELLADERDKPFKRHRFKTFFQINYVDAPGQGLIKTWERGYFPSTVGTQMRDYLKRQEFDFKESFTSTSIVKKGVEGVVRRRSFSDVNNQVAENYTNSKGKDRTTGYKEIVTNNKPVKSYEPNLELYYSDERDGPNYTFFLNYYDHVLDKPKDEAWSQAVIIPRIGSVNANPVIIQSKTTVPPSLADNILFDTGNNRNDLFSSFLMKKINLAGTSLNSVPGIVQVYKAINKEVSNKVVDYVLDDPNGGMSNGFKYGYVDEEALTPDDFEYVDPEPGSTEYTYEEEEGVLGRSKTNHPRIIFLDPTIYGGRYKNPSYYIEPQDHDGWLGFAQNLIPGLNFCNDKNIDLLDFNYIKEQVNFFYNNMPTDERLQQEKECTVEPPFGKIADRQTKGNIHGITTTIIRIYLAQMYLNGFALYSNVSFNSKNYSNLLSSYVAHLMESDVADTPENESAFIRTKIKRENYWLLFLEQAVESYQRLIDHKNVVPTQPVAEALDKIKTLQAFYKHPTKNDAAKIDEDQIFDLSIEEGDYEIFQRKEYIKFFKHALAYQAWPDAILKSKSKVKLKRVYKTDRYVEYLRFASKIFAIKLIKEEAMVVLGALTAYESDQMFKKIDDAIKPSPPINSIVPYILQQEHFTEDPKHKFGLRKPLVELEINGVGDFGTVKDVVHNPFEENPLRGTPKKTEANKFGRFVIERYIRIKDKDVPVNIPNRDEYMKGIVGVKKFNDFVQENKNSPAFRNKKISDLFGNLEFIYTFTVQELVDQGYSLRKLKSLGLSERIMRLTEDVLASEIQVGENDINFEINKDPIAIDGVTGLNYGLRLSYVLPDSVDLSSVDVSDEKAIETKAYKLKRVDGVRNSRFLMPIASVEVEMVDQSWEDVNFLDGENAFDLYCMFQLLEENEDYRFFFDTGVPVGSYLSTLALYSNYAWEASWGLGQNERVVETSEDYEEPPDGDRGVRAALRKIKVLFKSFFKRDEDVSIDGDGEDFEFNIFQKAKKRSRKLFVNFYNQDDFFDDEAANEDNLFEFMRLFNPFKFPIPRIIPWWRRRKRAKARCPAAEE